MEGWSGSCWVKEWIELLMIRTSLGEKMRLPAHSLKKTSCSLSEITGIRKIEKFLTRGHCTVLVKDHVQ